MLSKHDTVVCRTPSAGGPLHEVSRCLPADGELEGREDEGLRLQQMCRLLRGGCAAMDPDSGPLDHL